ncbi:hypothetical protein LXL04_002277 [Taraxacum kok-saghyz]
MDFDMGSDTLSMTFGGTYLYTKSFSKQIDVVEKVRYRGIANFVTEPFWLHNLLLEQHYPTPTTITVFCDNISVVYMLSNSVQQHRTLHTLINMHYVLCRRQSRHLPHLCASCSIYNSVPIYSRKGFRQDFIPVLNRSDDGSVKFMPDQLKP